MLIATFTIISIFSLAFEGISSPVHRSKRGQILYESTTTRWPNKTVPYEFSTSAPLTDLVKQRFYRAVQHWQQFTCLRFEPFNPLKHKSYLSKLVVANRGNGYSKYHQKKEYTGHHIRFI